jgi:hypothetical protein
MVTECIPEMAQVAEPPTSGPRRRLPRRARGFYYLTEADVRAVVMQVGFSPEAIGQIQYPERSWECDFLFRNPLSGANGET